MTVMKSHRWSSPNTQTLRNINLCGIKLVHLVVCMMKFAGMSSSPPCTCAQSFEATPSVHSHKHANTHRPCGNRGDIRKMSYPAQPAPLGPLTLLHARESQYGTTNTTLSRPLQRCLLLLCGVAVWVQGALVSFLWHLCAAAVGLSAVHTCLFPKY